MSLTKNTTELQVTNLNAAYKENLILNDINLSILQGEFVCLCGPNGAGKSTLLSVMAGVPDAKLKVKGNVYLVRGENAVPNSENTGAAVNAEISQNIDISRLPRSTVARILAYMQQSEYSEWDFTVRDYVLQGRYAYARGGAGREDGELGELSVGGKLKELFKYFGPAQYTAADNAVVDGVLADLNLTSYSNRTIHSLSGGEFQKVRLARSLAQTPRFLLLDEPAANLDYVFEPHLMSLLRETAHSKNLGVLAAVHDINLAARFADKIILLPPARISNNFAHASDNSETSANSNTTSTTFSSPKKSVLSGAPSDIMNIENLKYTFGVDFECREIKSFQSLQ